MKKLFLVGIIVGLFACEKQPEFKLQPDTPAYDLATKISEKIPYLDPEENNVLVSTKRFDITSGQVFDAIQSRFGSRASQLTNMEADQIKNIVTQTATNVADNKLLLRKAKNEGYQVSDAELDSTLNTYFDKVGGKEKYIERLSQNGMTLEQVKEDMREGMTIQNYLDEEVFAKVEVPDAEIRKVYEEDKTATVRHILFSTRNKSEEEKEEVREKAEKVLKEAKSGKDFAKLAEKYTEDPGSKEKGGLYEDFPKGQMVKEFEDAAFTVPEGEISDLVETNYGYHIIKVIERKKETRPFDQVKSEIKNKLVNPKKNELYQEHLEKIKKDVKYEMAEF